MILEVNLSWQLINALVLTTKLIRTMRNLTNLNES